MDKVLIVGAGGHGRVVGELVDFSSDYEHAGWVDKGPVGNIINGRELLGDDDTLADLYDSGISKAVIGVGSVGDTSVRKRLVSLLNNIGYDFIQLAHPSSIISKRIDLGEGTCVMAGSVIQTGSTIGSHCIVNSRVVVEHDCQIGSFVHLSPGALLAGGVEVENDVHVGLGAKVLEGIRLGRGAMIGAGAVVIEDVAPGLKVAGCPATII